MYHLPPCRYFTVDVFTESPFGGNQLAVIPDARGLSDAHMLAITREFNFAESAFVLPPDDSRHARRVRIFNVSGEMPFAGHPTVGTAFVLASIGEIAVTGPETRIVLEEGVGPIPVVIRGNKGSPWFIQFSVAKLPEITPSPVASSVIASMLSLEPADLLGGDFPPATASCGLPFLLVPVRGRAEVARSRLRTDLWEASLRGHPGDKVFVFALEGERPGSDVHARMYAPGIMLPEDPATGSAAAALGGYLASRSKKPAGTLRWVIEQGFTMGRPSIIEVEVDMVDSRVSAVRVGGRSVMMSAGSLFGQPGSSG